MMHQGLDLSRFKKIASDKKTSTLRHSKGHEIKIAHDGLSPAMKDHIVNMPIHLAEGGDVEDPEDDSSPAAPAPPDASAAPEEAPDEEAAAAEEPAAPADGAEAPAEPKAESAPASPIEPSASEDKQAAVSDGGNTVVVKGKRAPPTPQDLDQEDAHFQNDIMKGQIHPETVQSLYAKQDTMGKIGTLFGLLVGGMGSGMTGQPNAVLEMMKNQIANDIEAQKATNANAQNWYQLSLKHEMQKASMKQMAIQNELTKGQTEQTSSATELNKKHSALADEDIEAKALNNAWNKGLIGVKLKALGITDALPEGAAKQRAQNAYQNQLAPAIDQEIKKNNSQLSAKLQLKHAIRTQQEQKTDPAKSGPSLVDTDKIQQLEYNGTKQGALGIGGLMGAHSAMSPQQASAARDEAAMVNKNRLAYDNISRAFETLDKQAAGGKINPKNYATYKDHLVGQLVQTGIPKDQAEHLAISSLPGPTDWGATRATKAAQLHDQFMTMEARTGNLKPFGLLPPFPPPPKLSKTGEVKKTAQGIGSAISSVKSALTGSANAAPALREGMTGMSGKTPVVVRNGKWVPQ